MAQDGDATRIIARKSTIPANCGLNRARHYMYVIVYEDSLHIALSSSNPRTETRFFVVKARYL